MSNSSVPKQFINARHELVDYDGKSPVTWRVSIYGLYIENDTLLVIKNKNENHWDVPGGGVEMGESLIETLVRESKEEAGWNLTPTCPLWESVDWFYHEGDNSYHRSLQLFWLAEGSPLGHGPTDPNVTDVRQVPLDELAGLPFYPAAMTALEKAPGVKV